MLCCCERDEQTASRMMSDYNSDLGERGVSSAQALMAKIVGPSGCWIKLTYLCFNYLYSQIGDEIKKGCEPYRFSYVKKTDPTDEKWDHHFLSSPLLSWC